MARQTRSRSALPPPADAGRGHAAEPDGVVHGGRAVLIVALVLLALPEIVLWGADLGLWGTAAWRPMAYQYGAFWSGLLRDWRPNYALQPALMFVTYAFLHAGPSHLAGNVLTLALLGPAVARWIGGRRALAVCAAAALGGAMAFGLLSLDVSPMVGASGVVFGLGGALAAREAAEPGGWPRALAVALGLALANLLMWAAMERVAWQTHAGGAVAGALAAWALRPQRSAGPGVAAGTERPPSTSAKSRS